MERLRDIHDRMTQIIHAKTAHVLTSRNAGHLDLRCGNCGGMEFNIHVQMHLNEAKISRCRCAKCGQVRAFDAGVLQASGKVDLKAQ